MTQPTTEIPPRPAARMLAVVLEILIVPGLILAPFRWYRRAVGGLWSRVEAHVTDAGAVTYRWARVSKCPADRPGRRSGDVPPDACGPTYHGTRCVCEPWP